MERLTERDEFGNADIIGVDSEEMQINLDFAELNRVTFALNKLAEYEDIEEQGKLLKLPCAVGDIVYIFMLNNYHSVKAQIKKIEVKHTVFEEVCYFVEPVAYRGKLFKYYKNDFGEHIFLSEQEAEAALQGKEKNRGKE